MKIGWGMGDRHAFRAQWHDYKSGIYFVTICAFEKQYIFGKIGDDKMIFSAFGKIVDNCLRAIPKHHINVELWHYIVMPNHIHMVLCVGAPQPVGAQNIAPLPIWQRSYHEHVIRDRRALGNIMNYIDANILKWNQDCFYRN